MKLIASLDRVNEALKKLQEKGTVNLSGSKGTFSVSGVRGSFDYHQQTKELFIQITDKPWLVSTEYVESEIRKFFGA